MLVFKISRFRYMTYFYPHEDYISVYHLTPLSFFYPKFDHIMNLCGKLIFWYLIFDVTKTVGAEFSNHVGSYLTSVEIVTLYSFLS